MRPLKFQQITHFFVVVGFVFVVNISNTLASKGLKMGELLSVFQIFFLGCAYCFPQQYFEINRLLLVFEGAVDFSLISFLQYITLFRVLIIWSTDILLVYLATYQLFFHLFLLQFLFVIWTSVFEASKALLAVCIVRCSKLVDAVSSISLSCRIFNLLFTIRLLNSLLVRINVCCIIKICATLKRGGFLQGIWFTESPGKTRIAITTYSCKATAGKLVQFTRCCERKH